MHSPLMKRCIKAGWDGSLYVHDLNSNSESLILWSIKEAPDLFQDVLNVSKSFTIDLRAFEYAALHNKRYFLNELAKANPDSAFLALVYNAHHLKDLRRIQTSAPQSPESAAPSNPDHFTAIQKIKEVEKIIQVLLTLPPEHYNSNSMFFYNYLSTNPDLDIVKSLIQAGYDLHFSGNHADLLTASVNNPPVFEYLLSWGLNPNTLNSTQSTILMQCLEGDINSMYAVEKLWPTHDPHHTNSDGQTALMLAKNLPDQAPYQRMLEISARLEKDVILSHMPKNSLTPKPHKF